MSEKKIAANSKYIQYHYKLTDKIKIVKEFKYITLISENMGQFSIEFNEASLEELNNLKEKGKPSSFLLDGQSLSQPSDPSNPEHSPLFIALFRKGLFSIGIKVNNKTIITLEDFKPLRKLISPINDSTFFYLSPTCWIKPLKDNFILQDASQSCQLIFHDIRYLKVVSELSNVKTIKSLNQALGQDFDLVTPFVIELMLCASLIQCSSELIDQTSETSSYSQYWSFEDLLFHERSRWGPHNRFIGANFPLEEIIPTPSITPKINFTKVIPLIRPNNKIINPSFFDVILQRKSYHEFGSQPVSLKQLSLLLWFVLHIKSRLKIQSTGEHQTAYEITKRPVPGGGGIHEIEIYLTVNRCENIESGLYHYNAAEHCLEMIKCRDESCLQLLSDAACAAKLTKNPDILITLACRYERLAWKYQGIVYSLILKHVGVIYQQLYLVSTALGLAACALGVGNSRTFQNAPIDNSIHQIGSSVGEFILGTKPDFENFD